MEKRISFTFDGKELSISCGDESFIIDNFVKGTSTKDGSPVYLATWPDKEGLRLAKKLINWLL